MEYKDYYDILGVNKNASKEEIQKAFRKKAQKHHPDVNPDDPSAEERFKEINEAYQVLSDSEKREKYDRFGQHWKQYQQTGGGAEDFDWSRWASGSPGGQRGGYTTRRVSPEEFEEMFGGGGLGGFSDFFETLFGGAGTSRGFGFRDSQPGGTNRQTRQRRVRPQPGRDLEHMVEISLNEAFHGTSRIIQKSDGSKIEAKIPRGVRSGSRVRLSGQGQAGMRGGNRGDLYLKIKIRDHPRFDRKGNDLKTTKSVDLYTLVLGGETKVSSIDKTVKLDIPAGTKNNTTFRLSGLGMPNLNDQDQRGDLYVKVEAEIPENLSSEEKELFKQLREMNRK